MKKILLALMVAGLVVALAAPAFADETFGGRVRWQWGYEADSEELTDNGDTDIVSGFMSVSGTSYFRVTFESKDKKVGVRIEIGLDRTVTRRPVFGWYTIGNCKIVAGNNYTWAGDGVIGAASWLIDPTGGGMGLTYHGRRPMVALEWRSGNFGVQVGLFEPQAQRFRQRGRLPLGSAHPERDRGHEVRFHPDGSRLWYHPLHVGS
jgi:hypothetical protein